MSLNVNVKKVTQTEWKWCLGGSLVFQWVNQQCKKLFLCLLLPPSLSITACWNYQVLKITSCLVQSPHCHTKRRTPPWCSEIFPVFIFFSIFSKSYIFIEKWEIYFHELTEPEHQCFKIKGLKYYFLSIFCCPKALLHAGLRVSNLRPPELQLPPSQLWQIFCWLH